MYLSRRWQDCTDCLGSLHDSNYVRTSEEGGFTLHSQEIAPDTRINPTQPGSARKYEPHMIP